MKALRLVLPLLLTLFVACGGDDKPIDEPQPEPTPEQPTPQPDPQPDPTPDPTPEPEKFSMQGKSLAILGDSYSTYGGWIPEGYLSWYGIDGVDGKNSSKNDVSSVSDTWWHILMAKYECKLLINSSYSGSPVSYTGYKTDSNPTGDERKTAFITRMKNDLSASKVKPELILILGGTNDHYAGAPSGAIQYADWNEEDLKCFFPAFAYLLDYLTRQHPTARIVNIQNDCFSAEEAAAIAEITAHYKVQNVVLTNIKGSANLQGGHPTKATMARIAEQVERAVNE